MVRDVIIPNIELLVVVADDVLRIYLSVCDRNRCAHDERQGQNFSKFHDLAQSESRNVTVKLIASQDILLQHCGAFETNTRIMNGKDVILAAGALFLFAGCITPPDNTSDVVVRVGMSRTELRVMYGEPLRIEPNASGGEDWYYHFYSRYHVPNVSATVTSETDLAGNTISSTSDSLQLGKDNDEEPIHLSREGYVVAPLPSGKVLKNR